MQKISVQDQIEITSRSLTPEGFLVAPGILARTGIQDYLAYELGIETADPMKRVRLYRPADEVFHPESIASFENKPITIEHPADGVNADNWQDLAKGEVRDIKPFGNYMQGTLIVKSKDAIDAIQSGKCQLSNGYTFMLDWTSGKTPDGQDYDGVQRNIRGNHLAIVDAARCGAACRISDSQPLGEITMADANLRKVTVDGIPLEVSETAAAAIDKLTKERDAAVKTAADAQKIQFDGKDYSPVEMAKLAADQKAKIEELQKDVMTPAARDAMVTEWVKLAADAKRLTPDVVTDGKTCLAIRREVVAALAAKDAKAKAAVDAMLPAGKTVADAEPETVRAAFNVLAALVQEPQQQEVSDSSATAAAALLGTQQGQGTKKLVGRDAMLARQQSAYLGKE